MQSLLAKCLLVIDISILYCVDHTALFKFSYLETDTVVLLLTFATFISCLTNGRRESSVTPNHKSNTRPFSGTISQHTDSIT